MSQPDASGEGPSVPATDADRIALAEAWIAQDPDPETRLELETIVARVQGGDAAASADLADRFDQRLAFAVRHLDTSAGETICEPWCWSPRYTL